jgi:hypothetical protein
LLNQVRGLVKELLVGDYAISEASLSKVSAEKIATQSQREAFVERALLLINTLAEEMEPWNAIAAMSITDSMASTIPDLRQQYINLTGTGLVIIGRIAFEINKLPESQRAAKYKDLAKKVDWRREAELWQNTIIINGKMVTNRGPLAAASDRVKEMLGLPTKSVAATNA